MKVFDFTHQKRGHFIGHMPRPEYMSGHWATPTSKQSIDSIREYEFQQDCGKEYKGKAAEHSWTAQEWMRKHNVQAICYCSGQYTTGLDKGKWNWHFTATREWLEEHELYSWHDEPADRTIEQPDGSKFTILETVGDWARVTYTVRKDTGEWPADDKDWHDALDRNYTFGGGFKNAREEDTIRDYYVYTD